jgi:hypothetical protein
MSPHPSRLLAFVVFVWALASLGAPVALGGPLDTGPGSLAAPLLQQAELVADDGAANDHFGTAVAVDGDTAIVGASGVATSRGTAYIFTRSGGVWTLQQELTLAGGAEYDFFGNAVALSGDTALVGAYQKDVGSNPNQGAAYVFTRSGGVWTLQQELIDPGGSSGDYFGYDVALEGDNAIVGASFRDFGENPNQGVACVFTRSGTSWSLQQELIAADGAAYDYFGTAVSLSGDTALVGAYRKDVGGNTDQGAAYVFTRSGALWSQEAELTDADGAADERYGIDVALSGDTALVGAFYKVVGSNDSQGAAYVYTRSGTAWTHQAELTAADGAAYDYFGYAVALSGDTALVGAYGKQSYNGAAYVFTRSGTVWSQQQELTDAGGAASEQFGRAVALSGGTALVGADGKTLGATNQQGAVYVFAPHVITIGSPTAASTWITGSAQTALWSLDWPVPDGEFRVSLVSQTSGTWYVNKTLVGVASQLDYETLVKASVPVGTYKVAVYWRPAAGSGAWEAAAKSAAFSVTEVPTLAVTAPTATDVWRARGTRSVSWTVDPALDHGEFRVWLVNVAAGTWYAGRTVPAVAARSDYSTAFAYDVPAGTYKAAVYWRESSSSTWLASTKSAAFTVGVIDVTSPTAANSWPRRTTQKVEWTVAPALSLGEFRVCVVDQGTKTWYVNKVVPAVDLQTDYETPIYLAVPAGSYKATVYWRADPSSPWTLTAKTATFTVTS